MDNNTQAASTTSLDDIRINMEMCLNKMFEKINKYNLHSNTSMYKPPLGYNTITTCVLEISQPSQAIGGVPMQHGPQQQIGYQGVPCNWVPDNIPPQQFGYQGVPNNGPIQQFAPQQQYGYQGAPNKGPIQFKVPGKAPKKCRILSDDIKCAIFDVLSCAMASEMPKYGATNEVPKCEVTNKVPKDGDIEEPITYDNGSFAQGGNIKEPVYGNGLFAQGGDNE